MPEFILDKAGSVQIHGRIDENGNIVPDAPQNAYLREGGAIIQFSDLDEFTQGYIEALFFTNCDHSVSMVEIAPDHEFQDGSIPGDAGFSDLHPNSLANIIADCEAFQRENADLLAAAKELQPGSDGFRYGKQYLDDRRLGQLFFYDDQGHGISFDDDGDADCLQQLNKRALYYRERSISWGEAADAPKGYGFVFVD